MKVITGLRSKVNGIAFTAIFIILILLIGFGVEMIKFNAKIDKMNQTVKDVNQAITCPQIYNDGNTGKQYCISINDQLTDITDSLGKVQDSVNNICTPNVIGC